MKINANGIPFIVPFGGSTKYDTIVPKPRDTLGGKGTGLVTMSMLGLNVPPGFTITTVMCKIYNESKDIPNDIWNLVLENVSRLEIDMGRKFGDPSFPLLLSSRSGAKYSMPGMLDTVLNIGLNSTNVEGLAKASCNPRFAYDSFRRLLDMYGDVVLGIPHESFEDKLKSIKIKAGVLHDVELNADDMKQLCQQYLNVYKQFNFTFPEDPYDQLRSCVKAVFNSWNSPRAVKYREVNNIRDLEGTAVNIQAVVFGNLGPTSGTGVAFSRNPSTGENELYGEYLMNAQGEDVVSGIRTPEPISKLKQQLPDVYVDFIANIKILENHFKDMQDVEFTIENGRLWMLQCRNGKRTGRAAIRIASDLVREHVCSAEEALLKIEPDHVRQLLHPFFDPKVVKSSLYLQSVIAKGLPAGPGAAVGKVVFSPKEAEEAKRKGEDSILVREITSPEDVGGMWAAKGILTARGGMTSHAAVVARGWGKSCVCGCDTLHVDEDAGIVTIANTGTVIKRGDIISLNGATGEVIKGAIPVIDGSVEGSLGEILTWADNLAHLDVYANADSPLDAIRSIELGSKGIGLCRTEHMFFSPDRLPVVRKWILKNEGIDDLKAYQRCDFAAMFQALGGKPCTIRLLDPPLHEFLPKPENVNENMAHNLGFDGKVSELIDKINQLHEENPMLGLRGCRLGIIHPDLTEMQVEAIMNAAYDAWETTKIIPRPRIMVPLIGHVKELLHQAAIIKCVCDRVQHERAVCQIEIPYEIGTMIEVPRAALLSRDIAAIPDVDETNNRLIDFFSYGTNDLTQMTFGISRDDSNEFIPSYLKLGILKDDPFKTIDEEGVGILLKMSSEAARATNSKICLSVCGEHGGDPDSIIFFHKLGLDYISCSPFRVPVARLVAGRAAAVELLSGRPSPDDIVEFGSVDKPSDHKELLKPIVVKKLHGFKSVSFNTYSDQRTMKT